MLIQKQKSRAKSKRNKPWKIGNKELKECTSYKYLGVTLKSTGSFSEHIDRIKEKAQSPILLLFLKAKNGVVFSHVCSFTYLIIQLLPF